MSNSILTMHVFVSSFCFFLFFCLTGSVCRVEYLFVFIYYILYNYCIKSIKLSFHSIACTTYYSQYSNMTVIYFKLVLHFLPVGFFSQFTNESNSQ